MATVATAIFAGALLGIALISRIPIWALHAWKEKSFLRLFLAHLLTYGFVVLAYALASRDGGTPQWQAAFAGFALPSLIVFTLDTIAVAAGRNAGLQASILPMWFLHAGGNQSGPLTTEALEAALAGGTVKPSDWIWRDGFKEWMQIEHVDLAKPEAAPAAPARAAAAETAALPDRWRRWFALSIGYWIAGLVIAALFAASSLALLNLEFADHPRLTSAGVITLWLMLLAAMLWLSIGVLRSVDQQAKIHPNRYWSGAAKVMTAIAGLAVLAVFVQRGVPEIRDSADVITETMMPRYQLRLLRDNTELELVGPMDFGVADTIAASLADNPAVVTLHVNSPGGRLSEADRLADTVLKKNLNTYVSTFCLGDCATVFAAGRNRWLSRSAVLALHQPAAEASDLEAETAKTKAFLEGRGIAVKFIDRGLASRRDAAWRPTHAELFNAGFATSYATDAEVATAGIPMREIEDAQKALDEIALYRVLREKHPEAHRAIYALVRNGYVKGQPAAAMRQRIWSVILPIVSKSLSSASDAALISFYGVAVDEAETFATKDARSCEAYLRGRSEGFDQSLLSADLQARELAATAELIRTSGSYVGRPIEAKEAQAVLAQLLPDALSKGFTPDDLEKAIQFKLSPERNCQGLILFFRALLQLADPHRTALLRFMAQQSGT
ncbi:MAG: GYF domain-containing protein [Parvibaculaceae bacterium]